MAAKTLGASNRSGQYQSTVPSVPTSAIVCSSPMMPCSAIGRYPSGGPVRTAAGATIASVIPQSLLYEDGARRRAVGSDDLQRKADEPVLARLDVPQVEPLHRDDACAEQDAVSVGVTDREIVQPDELDAAVEQRLRAAPREVDELVRKLVLLPQPRVRRLEEDPLAVLRQ